MTGEISVVNENGYGFIKSADVSANVFFHRTALGSTPFSEQLRGRRVRFELGEDQGKGPRAARVEVLE